MDNKYFELSAANKDCIDKFSDIANHLFEGTPIFEHACNYVNNSRSYRRNGRNLEILEIKDYSIIVKLTSESKLEMASKSLAGFTRELIRIDKEMNHEESKRLFRYFIYNSTLFRNVQIDSDDITIEMDVEMSDTDALKECVDLFCNSVTATKAEAARTARIKKEIKNLLMEYDRFIRMNSYATKMKRRQGL